MGRIKMIGSMIINSRGEELGEIEYDEDWKKWTFVPYPDTKFTWDCMNEITRWLIITEQLNKMVSEGRR